MISTQGLVRLAETGTERFLVDLDGDSYQVEGLPEDPPIPGLVVRPVGEAVKAVESGRVVSYVNRDSLWAVDGFVLDREVISAISGEVDTPQRLIEAVAEAGFDWHAVIPVEPEPSIS